MHDESDDRQERAQADALARLRQPVEPSPAAAQALRDALRRGGAFPEPSRSWRMPLAIAASLVIGAIAGREWWPKPVRVAAGDEYVIVLLNDPPPTWPAGTTEQQIVGAYRDWSSRLARAGMLSVAEELDPMRILVDGSGVRARGADGALEGLFLVRAESDSAASALASTLPHVRQGGVVAVQRVTTR
ncbi:MAG TPA: hypothetical protein VFZ73_18025 [Gemmatimonadaceae bacterium]